MIRRTRWTRVLTCLLVPALLGWGLLDLMLRRHGWIPALTPWGAGLALAVALVLLVAGLGVRRLRAHERTWMTPIGATTTAAAAQASAVVGSVLAGLYAAELLVAALAHRSETMVAMAWQCGGCLLACALWVATALLTESWCAIDTSQDPDADGPAAAGGAGSAPA